jgi:hypothetical protein
VTTTQQYRPQPATKSFWSRFKKSDVVVLTIEKSAPVPKTKVATEQLLTDRNAQGKRYRLPMEVRRLARCLLAAGNDAERVAEWFTEAGFIRNFDKTTWTASQVRQAAQDRTTKVVKS